MVLGGGLALGRCRDLLALPAGEPFPGVRGRGSSRDSATVFAGSTTAVTVWALFFADFQTRSTRWAAPAAKVMAGLSPMIVVPSRKRVMTPLAASMRRPLRCRAIVASASR